MKNTIKCPHCGKEFEVTEAFRHEIEEQLQESLKKKYLEEIETAKKTAVEDAELRFIRKITEERDRNKKLISQMDELLNEIQKLRKKDEEREIEMKKKLLDEEDRIKAEARKKSEEEHMLKDMEKDKKLSDALAQIEALKNKIQQGSQQAQGETLEMELEAKLRKEFPGDIISEVKKGVRGADVIQEIIDKRGRKCGTIIYESKNAAWSDSWLAKLKEDGRQAKADLCVLVAVNMPQGVENFAYKEGVWVVSWKIFLPISWSLRYNLVSLYNEKQTSVGKDEKMKILYQYLTGIEFKNRIEGIIESFDNLQEELEKEKRYFNVKWARQEKEIRKVMDHTHGMWGDLQGVVGKSLPEIKSLKLADGENVLRADSDD